MKLLKKIDLKGCGTGRQLRFGHLLGNGEYQMVMAQCQKRVSRDAYGTISCLTAFDLDGNILWQHGEPTDNHDIGTISADMPMQIYDIDGDGFDEVITAKNFEVLILDGRTGEVKKRAKTPFSTPEEDGTIIGVPDKIYAFDRINPDGMRICNFRGLEKPRDITLKIVIAGCMHLTMTLRLCGISRVIRIPDIFLLQLILTGMDMMNF